MRTLLVDKIRPFTWADNRFAFLEVDLAKRGFRLGFQFLHPPTSNPVNLTAGFGLHGPSCGFLTGTCPWLIDWLNDWSIPQAFRGPRLCIPSKYILKLSYLCIHLSIRPAAVILPVFPYSLRTGEPRVLWSVTMTLFYPPLDHRGQPLYFGLLVHRRYLPLHFLFHCPKWKFFAAGDVNSDEVQIRTSFLLYILDDEGCATVED